MDEENSSTARSFMASFHEQTGDLRRKANEALVARVESVAGKRDVNFVLDPNRIYYGWDLILKHGVDLLTDLRPR